MLPAQILSRFSRQLFPSSKSTATFHLLIQRLRFVLFLPKIRVSLSVSSSVNTFSYFPLFFPSLVLSALVFSGKSWWKVQVSTLTSARELAVTDFFLRIIRVLFLCVCLCYVCFLLLLWFYPLLDVNNRHCYSVSFSKGKLGICNWTDSRCTFKSICAFVFLCFFI